MEAEYQSSEQPVQPSQQNSKKPLRNQVVLEDSDSDWSLGSIEEMKGMSLKDIVNEDNQVQNNDGSQFNQKKELKVVVPEKPLIAEMSTLNEVGEIVYHVGGLIIVKSVASKGTGSIAQDGVKFVVDLENWLYTSEKNPVGFVMDVLGKVEHPFYVIKPQIETPEVQFPAGTALYYVQGTKVLKQEDLSSIRTKTAMDAEQIEGDSGSQKSEGGHSNKSDRGNQRDRSRKPYNNNYQKPRFDRRRDYDDNHNERQYSAQHPRQQRDYRSRTREHLKSRRNQQFQPRQRQRFNPLDQQMNQAYLQGVYSLYHQQMMQFHYGQAPPTNPTQQQPYPPYQQPPNQFYPNPNPNPNQQYSPNNPNQQYPPNNSK